MARASLQKMLRGLISDIEETTYTAKGGVKKTGAQIYREMKADKQVHSITIDAQDIIKQIKISMYEREGIGEHKGATTQKTAKGGAVSVFAEGTPEHTDKIIKTLDAEIKKQVPGLCTYIHDEVEKLQKTPGKYKIVAADLAGGPTKFSFMMAVTKEDEESWDVFGYFKRIKQNAQKDLITGLNKWAENSSRRDTSREERRSTDKKYADTSKYTNSGDVRYEKNDKGKFQKITMVSKTIRPGEGLTDIGHMEGSAVSQQRESVVKQGFEKQKELWEMDTSSSAAAVRGFITSMQTDIKWTVANYQDVNNFSDVSRVTIEATGDNRRKGAVEEATALEHQLYAQLKKLNEDESFAEMEGSDSMLQKIDKAVKNSLVKEIAGNKSIKRINLEHRKVKVSKAKAKQRIRKPKITVGTIAAIKTNDITKTRASFKKKGKNVRKRASAAVMPLELIGLINKELPAAVEGNMGAPSLTNQTGRFASSVRATDMSMTPQGFPSIGYTYQRDPYGVFEQDSDYDPRKLIDRSMREIAAQFAIGRFYTRRV